MDAGDDMMRRAIAQARKGARKGDRKPGANGIGCVIVRDGRVLAEGFNEVDARHDPTAHAEIVTVQSA